MSQLESETANELDEQPLMTVCAHCNEPIQRVGEDYLDWCEGCQLVEGETKEITEDQYEAMHT